MYIYYCIIKNKQILLVCYCTAEQNYFKIIQTHRLFRFWREGKTSFIIYQLAVYDTKKKKKTKSLMPILPT